MPVHFASRTNSTIFTDCCSTAVLPDQRCCPQCGMEIPYTQGGRWRIAMAKQRGQHFKAMGLVATEKQEPRR